MASEIAVSHPAPDSDRVATPLVAVGLGATPFAPLAIAEARVWEAVDLAVVVAEEAAVVAAEAEEAGGK
jgi:hypothetical protein